MANRHRNDVLFPALAIVLDAAAIEASFLLSYWLRFNTGLLSFLPLQEEIPPLRAYAIGSLFVIVVWLLLFRSRGMYAVRRNVSLADELGSIVRLVTLGMLVVMSAAFFYRAFSYSRVVFGLLWIVSIALLFCARAIYRAIEHRSYSAGRQLQRVIIIGSNETARRIAGLIRAERGLGYDLVGYCADAPAGIVDAPYLGTLANVPDVLMNESIGRAFLTLEHEDTPAIHTLMQACEGINCEFLLAPDILSLLPSGLRVSEIEGIPFIKIKGMPMSSWGRIIKRTFDIVISGILLIPCAPLFCVVAGVIKLTSRGPVFFRQERVGLDGERFFMLKFRSMKQDAEEETGPVWAKENDPRSTPIGALLRKTSIDELPQLWNVFTGDMSLVGPRPERPFFVDQFKRLVPKYLDRHRVKTGMTGWAQVNGLRGNTSLEERVKYDIYYIENWSLAFDMKILFRTLGSVISSEHGE